MVCEIWIGWSIRLEMYMEIHGYHALQNPKMAYLFPLLGSPSYLKCSSPNDRLYLVERVRNSDKHRSAHFLSFHFSSFHHYFSLFSFLHFSRFSPFFLFFPFLFLGQDLMIFLYLWWNSLRKLKSNDTEDICLSNFRNSVQYIGLSLYLSKVIKFQES